MESRLTPLDLIAVGDAVRITRERSELIELSVNPDFAGKRGIVDRIGEGAFARVVFRGGERAYLPTRLVRRVARRPK